MRARTTGPHGLPGAPIDGDSPAAPEPDGAWTFALRADDLWDGEMVGLSCGGADVLIAKLGAEVLAYENRCPHAGTRLSDGVLSATRLTCGAHRWEFDLRTGDGINPRRCQLRRYPVKIVDGNVLVLAR